MDLTPGAQAAARLKKSLKDRSLTIGSWLSLAAPDGAEIMARAGFDWLVVDMEHTATSMSDMARLIQIVDLAGVAPLVRVGANDPLLIKRALDCGAGGVIVPNVTTVEEARAAVKAAYYPPLGTRGVGLFRAQNYGLGFEAYKQHAAQNTIVIVQIEHHTAVDHLFDILTVEGVDGFILGPYDLSGSLRKPGQFDDPEVKAIFQRIVARLDGLPKPGGLHVVEPDQEKLDAAVDAGYRIIAYGVDELFLARSASAAGAHAARLTGATHKAG